MKFCVVGGSGVLVDMGLLFVLADPRALGLNLSLSKACAAEAALINNFIWNELWTFRPRTKSRPLSSLGGEGRGEGVPALSSPSPVRFHGERRGPDSVPVSAACGQRGVEAGAQARSLSSSTEERDRVRSRTAAGLLRRLVLFNAICGAGIGLAVLLLHLFHTGLGWNRYLSNLLVIGLVTLWNFGLNASLTWPRAGWAEPHGRGQPKP